MTLPKARRNAICTLAGVLALAGGSAFGAPAQTAAPRPFVSPIFGDKMVLQRGKPNAIWGWSQSGDSVRVAIGENSATAAPSGLGTCRGYRKAGMQACSLWEFRHRAPWPAARPMPATN
jgi:hypothetical protein